MMFKHCFISTCIVVLGLHQMLSAGTPKAIAVADVRGGLVVCLECRDLAFLRSLHANDRFLVNGLTSNPEFVATARHQLAADGQYGPVTVDQFDGKHLPYVDNLVNLIVVPGQTAVQEAELMRVLCPGGVLFRKQDGHWLRVEKQGTETRDRWSHFLHDASNNAVAADRQVGPPRGLQWTCGPQWARSHEFVSSLAAMVTDNGRLFYIFDEGLTSITDAPIPERWTLTARDAFNGVLLWKRPLPGWGTAAWKRTALRSVPATVPREIVADGDCLYCTLDYLGPVSVLDAATGQVIKTLPNTKGTDELRLVNEVLIAKVGKNRLVAIDLRDGHQLWEVTGRIQPMTFAADPGHVVYQDGPRLVCIGLRDAQMKWSAAFKSKASLLVLAADHVLVAAGKQLQSYDLATGKLAWSVPGNLRRQEMFVAQDKIWHWQENNTIVGRDMNTGRVVTTPDTSDAFTLGHHLRCYQSKATENYLITPNRGAEFISLSGGQNTENDWLRAACRYGVVPANGLLYSSPHPCMCYPGVLLTGFNALTPTVRLANAKPRPNQANRLLRGPAFDQLRAKQTPSSHANGGDWPTYRHDMRRSGASSQPGPTKLATGWRAQLPGRLTPPVTAGGRIYIATKDTHTLYALDLVTGQVLWHYVAGGRIDSPPTIDGERVLFGSADGHVTCLCAKDGQLAWRFRAAPSAQRIVVDNRLESPWRCHGSVLLHKGLVYFTAGRSTYLDGGIWIYALNPATGAMVHSTHIDQWAPTRHDAEHQPFIPGYHMDGAHSDVLVCQDDALYLSQLKFDDQLQRMPTPYVLPDKDHPTKTIALTDKAYFEPDQQPNGKYEERQREWLERTQKGLVAKLRQKYGGFSLGDRRIGLHVFSPAGFLDDSWFNRTFWMYSATWPGYYLAHRASKTGQLLVVGPKRTYAVQAFPTRNFQSPLFTPGQRGYLLTADADDSEPVLDDVTRGTTKGWGFTRKAPPDWFRWVPIRIRAMALAGNRLYVVGPPDRLEPDDPMASFEGRLGSDLRVIDATNGQLIEHQHVPWMPIFDGLIVARDRLLIATTDGRVVAITGDSKR